MGLGTPVCRELGGSGGRDTAGEAEGGSLTGGRAIKKTGGFGTGIELADPPGKFLKKPWIFYRVKLFRPVFLFSGAKIFPKGAGLQWSKPGA